MRRLRSSTVVLGGMGVLAATITACGSEPDKRCVDPLTREQLPRYECGSGSSGSGSGSGTGGSGTTVATPRGSYYYGGSVSDNKVSGGSFNKSAVDSGGFGCSRTGGG
ncbi:hypothetical protein ACIGW0_13095 [Streptomyces bikiniensis]|uniref:Lipoprotein n=1 Tax=Streptomyces bikiniensis TaxID=1896 RepID=A0ABW8CU66_STRBI